ncbi:UDP-N-acetylmuramate:L-alanyl-gamma-D-glutamyl-meso-diaminopimelate ligase [bacterium]|nr:UDP-N-acetylmuramate:L-alanyl-gamma-D-glutamyl-meso-diaminopimelate ligase [bacterium]
MTSIPELDQASLQRVAEIKKLSPGAKIHLIGICGTGMAAVAALLVQLGYQISGSDKAFYPPMGPYVRSLTSALYQGFSLDNFKIKPDLVVIGNSIRSDNVEVDFTLKQKIPYASMPEVFAALLIGERDFCPRSIVVSGTHGKTTTTAAIATLLDLAGLKPGYFIGGAPLNLPGSIRVVDTELEVSKRTVVLEGDEYDSAYFAKWPKFHSYRPDFLVITSIEFDHGDIYASLDEIRTEFNRLIKRVPKAGAIFVNADDPKLVAQVSQLFSENQIQAQVFFYGLSPSANFRLVSRTSLESGGQTLECSLDGQNLVMQTRLTGPHNALNLLVTASIGKCLGLSAEKIRHGVAEFRGVARRQQIIDEKNGITVLEDFAHHPTAVDLTLKGLKENYPGRRLIAVFEPRSNTSRRAFFQEAYTEAFSASDVAVVKKVSDASGYAKAELETKALDVELLIEKLKAKGKHGFSFSSVEEIREFLLQFQSPGDVIVFMSNGDFGGLMEQYIRSI